MNEIKKLYVLEWRGPYNSLDELYADSSTIDGSIYLITGKEKQGKIQRKKYWVGSFSKASNRNTRAHVELIETLFIHYLFIQDVRIINKDKLKKKPSVPLTVINRWILKCDDCHKVNKSSRLADLPDVILYDGEEYWGSEKLKYLVSE